MSLMNQKPNLSVDAWISCLNGKKTDLDSVQPKNHASVAHNKHLQLRNHTKVENPAENPKTLRENQLPPSGRRPKSRIASAGSQKLSLEAKRAFQDLGVETDDGEESPYVSPRQFFAAPEPAPSPDGKEDFLNESRVSNSKSETERSQGQMTAASTHDNSMAHRRSLSDRERVYVPLEIPYRSELKKITRRMGFELDEVNSMSCPHKANARNLSPANAKKSSATGNGLKSQSGQTHVNLPSCSRCRQQYINSILQNRPVNGKLNNGGYDSTSKGLQAKPVLAFNSSAPRKSFVDVHVDKPDIPSPQRSRSASPVRKFSSIRDTGAMSQWLSRGREIGFQLSSPARKQSSTPVNTKLAEASSPVPFQSRSKNPNYRMTVISKPKTAQSPRNASPKRLPSSGLASSLTKNKFFSETQLNKSQPLTSRKMERISKLQDSDGAKPETKDKAKNTFSSAKAGAENFRQKSMVNLDRRYEERWKKPCNGDANSDNSDDAVIEEIPVELRKQSVAKCKEWLALWFSATT